MITNWPATRDGLHLKSSGADFAIYSEETPGNLKAFYRETHIQKVKSNLNQREFWQRQYVSGNRMGPRAEQESRMAVGGVEYFLTKEDPLAGKKPLSQSGVEKLAAATAKAPVCTRTTSVQRKPSARSSKARPTTLGGMR